MSLADVLLGQTKEILEQWYEYWRRSKHPHLEIEEKALTDMLPLQLKLIGEQIKRLNHAESPENLWLVRDRLDPELRVLQRVPIEEVVQAYKIIVEVVRNRIESRRIDVNFGEYSYFYGAIFELVAESVRRYSIFQSEQVTKERSQYLAGISHQMKNPISAIKLQIELLSNNLQPARQSAVISEMEKNLNRLLFLVNGVMRLERFEPQEIPVRPISIHPATLIDGIMNENVDEAAQKNLRFEVTMNRTLRMIIDPDLFVDALGNLVQNAVKYTNMGFVRVEVEELPDFVYFRVHDSGPGISEERKQGLFAPIQSSKGDGVGIGLTIAQRAVQALGGSIGVDSKEGEGSVFWFKVPYEVMAKNVPFEPIHKNSPSAA